MQGSSTEGQDAFAKPSKDRNITEVEIFIVIFVVCCKYRLVSFWISNSFRDVCNYELCPSYFCVAFLSLVWQDFFKAWVSSWSGGVSEEWVRRVRGVSEESSSWWWVNKEGGELCHTSTLHHFHSPKLVVRPAVSCITKSKYVWLFQSSMLSLSQALNKGLKKSEKRLQIYLLRVFIS